MRRSFQWLWMGLLGAASLSAMSGCKPVSDKEKAYFDARDAERREMQEVREAIAEGSMDDEVLTMVKQSPAPEGEGDMEKWLQERINVPGGTVIFPQWNLSRRAVHRFDVRFTYTLIDPSNNVHRAGYTWQVDTILHSVSAPRVVVPDDNGVTEKMKTSPVLERFTDKDLNLE